LIEVKDQNQEFTHIQDHELPTQGNREEPQNNKKNRVENE
jgi:hypothetical protein